MEVAFYGGNFASLPESVQRGLLDPCQVYLKAGTVRSVRISTRPDSLDANRIRFLKAQRVGTVELGVQSLDNRVLKQNLRGHSAEDVERAVGLLREADMVVGIQLMLGLWGDTPDGMLRTARKTVALKPQLARIYPTLVLAGSALARLYRSGRYRPLSVMQAVRQCVEAADILEAGGVRVIRMGLQDTPGLSSGGVLAGPHHPAFGELVRSAQWNRRARLLLSERRPRMSARFYVHPSQVSKFAGQQGSNLAELKSEWNLQQASVVSDPSLLPHEVRLESS